MESQHNNTMESETSSSNIESYHNLSDNWTLWAHLPHNTDWSIKSYIAISTFTTIEQTLGVTGITISPKKNFCIIKIWMTDCNNQNPAIVTSDVKGISPQGCLFKKHTPEY